MSETAAETAFERLGGSEGVQRLAAHFYAVMESDPRCAELRAMHPPDLTEARAALAGFLTAWLGGPRDWLRERGRFCLMSRHAAFHITQHTAGQWMHGMRVALARTTDDEALAAKMLAALDRVAGAMAWPRKI